VTDRPPYRVPTLAEIEAAPANGLTVVSTFAGAGGSSTGWEMAGYRVRWANEFHPHAAVVYAANHPHTIVERRDIRRVTADDIVDAVGCVPDVLDGSPPCQDFSSAGKRSRGWGEVRAHSDGTRQRSDDLFGEYVRLVDTLRPRAFVAENVKGLVSGAAKGKFKQIVAALSACGYRVQARVLDAQWLGVPQRRKRVIIMGVRDDLGAEPRFPRPLPYRYSILDACPWLGDFGEVSRGDGFGHRAEALVEPLATLTAFAGGHDRWELRHHHTAGMKPTTQGLDQPAVTITAQPGETLVRTKGHGFVAGAQSLDEPVSTIIARYRPNESPAVLRRAGHGYFPGGDLGLDQPAPTITTDTGKGYAGRLVINAERGTGVDFDEPWSSPADLPSPTISAAGVSSVRPDQAMLTDGVRSRKLTIPEVMRLCSFPDDYRMHGSYNDQWSRLGNSVPPLMMRAVAAALAPVLLGVEA